MSTYVIGDIQGCYQQLQALLELIKFDPAIDTLWFTGDLVNRGPESLAVLRFLSQLSPPPITVLGNHDLHLLAVVAGVAPQKPKDTISDILTADDRQELCDWLRQQPLLHHDPNLGYCMVHAGLAPQWSLPQALSLAHEVETILRGPNYHDLLQNMYGSLPNYWEDNLTGWPRLRVIINIMTRVRFCSDDGHIELAVKVPPGMQPQELIPWYELPNRKTQNQPIIFGHWASLRGQVNVANVYALDTGCVWGDKLTAMRLEDQRRFSVRGLIQ